MADNTELFINKLDSNISQVIKDLELLKNKLPSLLKNDLMSLWSLISFLNWALPQKIKFFIFISSWFFLFNTIFISYKFGWKPALMSAILGLIIAFYFFIPPYNSIELPTKKDGLNLLFFSLLFITIIFLIEKLQRERFRAVLIARVSDSRMRIMAKLSSNKKNNLL